MSVPLSIIVVETDRTRAQLIVDSLRDAGDFDIFVISEVTGLARQIQGRNPDVVLIDIENPSRDTMEELALASGPLDRPVAMFVDRSDEGLSSAAIEAGVSAYIVDGLQPQRVKPILDAAIARFHMFQRMRKELTETKKALEERADTAFERRHMIQILNYRDFISGKNPDGFAAELGSACRREGVCLLSDHGIPRGLLRDVLGEANAFFALPEAEKAPLDIRHSNCNRGWAGPGVERAGGQGGWRGRL